MRRSHQRAGTWTVTTSVLLLLLGGCQGLGPVTAGPSAQPTAGGAGPGGAAPGHGIVVADRHGWTSAGIEGRVPPPGSCHARRAADGETLPDPACTPGAIDSAVNDGDTRSTICRKGGYTSSVRPPASLTEPVKRQLLAAYGIPQSQISRYELDHLIDLAAGGASDVRNLWPEPNTTTQFQPSTYVHNDKDAVESYTYRAICQGRVTVTAVRDAIDADWTTAVATLGLPPIPPDYRG